MPNTELGHLELNGKEVEPWASDRVRKDKDLSWKKWSARLEAYFHHLEFIFSPDLFIIGGGVSKKSEKFFPHISLKTPLEPAMLLNEAGIVGAAIAATQYRFE
jgi:polyphosphate glucokinase